MRRKLNILFLILTLLFIWGQSCLPVAASEAESGAVLGALKPGLSFFLGEGRVTMHLVRKLAHFTEFSVLGFLMAGLFPAAARKQLSAAGLSLLCALLDETIQLFTGRGSQISDVWLDFFGAAVGIAVCFLIRLIRRRRKPV